MNSIKKHLGTGMKIKCQWHHWRLTDMFICSLTTRMFLHEKLNHHPIPPISNHPQVYIPSRRRVQNRNISQSFNSACLSISWGDSPKCCRSQSLLGGARHQHHVKSPRNSRNHGKFEAIVHLARVQTVSLLCATHRCFCWLGICTQARSCKTF